MNWLQQNGWQAAALVLMALGICALMPRARTRSRTLGLLLAFAGTAIALWLLPTPAGLIAHSVLFWLFAASAILCGVLMITSRNPVYAALWFALVTLATCGLFLLQQAAFLAAATIIVYAGAIIVTFLFVIMLAQQAGATAYDQHSHHVVLASVGAFVLFGALLATLRSDAWPAARPPEEAAVIEPALAQNGLSRTHGADGKMQSLGRSLFGDYLYAVELAGTVLLVASIGAIAIAPRRSQGTL
ncbi:MAG: NADH-quinone oxidoreductase subunit J [Planctomycetaceae bacterium]|nr:NADH-quinone oxidoreductase subunit J [Planctomycetaceae bacterium]